MCVLFINNNMKAIVSFCLLLELFRAVEKLIKRVLFTKGATHKTYFIPKKIHVCYSRCYKAINLLYSQHTKRN